MIPTLVQRVHPGGTIYVSLTSQSAGVMVEAVDPSLLVRERIGCTW